jgi:4-amino-4-deoxy-L-arabinose transferase-like glycosyltransferase
MQIKTHWINRNRHSLLVALIILFGTAIRVTGISTFPGGLGTDEASIGYEAFSILTTGCDRNGQQYPVHLIAWGSGQNALSAYLLIPFIKMWGLTPFSVRFLNALFSSLALIVFYLLVRSAWGKKKSLVALLFLCIAPWDIMNARFGVESNIFPAIFLFAVYFLYRGMVGKPFNYLIASSLFAISLYAYGTSYLIVPVFFLFLIPYLICFKRISMKYLFLSGLIFTVIASPIILFVLINHLDLPPIHLAGFTVPRLLENRTTHIFNLFSGEFPVTLIRNISRSLFICFLQTDELALHAVIPAFGTTYHVSNLFFCFGLFSVIRNREKYFQPIYFILLAWFVCAVMLSFCIHTNTTRINIIYFPITFFVVSGFFSVYEALRSKYRNRFIKILCLLYGLLFLCFAGYYLSFFDGKIKRMCAYGFKEALQYCNDKYPSDTINITTQGIHMPYSYVCFYNRTDPDVFRKTVVYDENRKDFRQVRSFDKYRFVPDGITKDGVAIISKKEFEALSLFNVERESVNFGEFYVIHKK